MALLGGCLADSMQNQRDERESAATIVARLDERAHLVAQLDRWPVANQPTGALEDTPFAQRVDFGFNLLDAAS